MLLLLILFLLRGMQAVNALGLITPPGNGSWVRIPPSHLNSRRGSKADRLIWDQDYAGSSPAVETNSSGKMSEE